MKKVKVCTIDICAYQQETYTKGKDHKHIYGQFTIFHFKRLLVKFQTKNNYEVRDSKMKINKWEQIRNKW
ncbi:hypothetical protein ACE939_06905 [Aquimarina sp. W85]|uniref:hypothetical protein n=1 Tax=Aquimarina rhodophyticola TaxID=3342246 RepID=UPI003671B21C